MQQLSVTQAQLILRSGVSKAIVGELVHGNKVRHRSPRTLEAISEALEWHRDHLEALLQGRTPPELVQPARQPPVEVGSWQDEIATRLATIEQRIVNLDRKIDELSHR
jgi:hypothetical protein